MKKKLIYVFAASSILFSACKKDLQFDDPRTLTLDEAANVKGAFLKFANSAVLNALGTINNGSTGVHILCLADQITTTNRFNEFWDFAQEPRKALTNSQTYNGYGVFRDHWAGFAQANLDANQVILAAKAGTKLLDAQGVDRTTDALAAAYFAKGIAQGYTGAMYDRGIIVDVSSDQVPVPNDYPNSYKEMVANGVKQLDEAIATATAATTFKFDFIPGQSLTKTQFIQWCNSMAARIMASAPRDLTEAQALGAAYWNKVYDYANKGLTSDLLNAYATDGFYNGTVDWSISLLGDGAGYLPVDIKVAWLANNSHPKYYPSGTTVLPALTTNDNRFYQYFGYTPNFGFLRADRNRGLFTNYFRKRWDNASNTVAEPGAISPLFLVEEVRLLKAEAKLFAGDAAAAALILNEPTARRITVGGLPPVLPTVADVRYALHYEYSIEIDNAAGVLEPWAFMRRNNLLIGGTPTQLPVPEVQMNVLKAPPYTFGGTVSFGAKGKFNETATAANVGWKASE